MDDIQKAIQEVREERLKHMRSSFSNISDLADDDSIKKADDAEEEVEEEEDFDGNSEEVEEETEDDDTEKAENPFDRYDFEEGEEVEKSDILNAISGYGDSKLKVSKTGKEIKEQVDSVILPQLTADLAAKKVEADNKLKDCGTAPTKEPEPWWTSDVRMEVGYKVYDWREQNFCQEEKRMYPTFSAEDEQQKKGNCPTSEAEAKARCEYNEIVRCICNIMVDIKACEILKILKDSSQYELNPRQVLSLKFT